MRGDSVSWTDDPFTDNQGNYMDAGIWTLKYAIRGSAALDLTATVAANGRSWDVSITPAQSATLSPGKYGVQAYLVDAGNTKRITVGTGTLEILTDMISAGGGYDNRLQMEKDLEAVQGAIRAMASGGAVQEYTIGNRHIRKMNMSDLVALEAKLKNDIARARKAELIKNGMGNPHNLFVRFT